MVEQLVEAAMMVSFTAFFKLFIVSFAYITRNKLPLMIYFQLVRLSSFKLLFNKHKTHYFFVS